MTNIYDQKNEVLIVNQLLTEYIALHNNFLKSAGTFSSLFRRVDFGQIAQEVDLLLQQFRDEKAKTDNLRALSKSTREKEFAECLNLYTQALTNTVQLLSIMVHALQAKAAGQGLGFQEHMANNKKYEESIQLYLGYGEELNKLYTSL